MYILNPISVQIWHAGGLPKTKSLLGHWFLTISSFCSRFQRLRRSTLATTSAQFDLIEDIFIAICVFLIVSLRNTDGTVIQWANSIALRQREYQNFYKICHKTNRHYSQEACRKQLPNAYPPLQGQNQSADNYVNQNRK